jgi:phosphoglycerate dehydrogenase-like enzyme
MTIRRTLLVALSSALLAAGAAAQTPAPKPQKTDGEVAAGLGLEESAKPIRETSPNWRQPKKVMVHVGNNPARLEFMREAVPAGVEIIAVKDKDEALKKIADADALIASVRWCTTDLLAAGKKLRWVHTNAAGVNECDLAEMRKRNIVLTNQQRTFGPEISDHVIALTLALTRGLDGALLYQRQAKWQRGAVPATRLWGLEGRTMLVVGLGGIGTQVAEKAHGLGMRVIATRGSSREGPSYVEYVGLADELPKLIGQADVVVNATPLTPQTTGLFNKAMFERMQKHALFITVGRGPSTVTDDLLEALKNGTIGGAGLDVTDPEPLPDGHPLWSAPNIIITPHMSAGGAGAGPGGDRPWQVMREQLRRFVAGDKLYSVVDLTRGY